MRIYWALLIICRALLSVCRALLSVQGALYTLIQWKEAYAPGFCDSRWRRCVGCLFFVGCFPQKSPIISGSFAERDLQCVAPYASSAPCRYSLVQLECRCNLWKEPYTLWKEPYTLWKETYSLVHLECRSISISNLNLFGFFSTERGKRDARSLAN